MYMCVKQIFFRLGLHRAVKMSLGTYVFTHPHPPVLQASVSQRALPLGSIFQQHFLGLSTGHINALIKIKVLFS